MTRPLIVNYILMQAFSQHTELSVLFMEHLISILNRSSLVKGDSHKGENTSSSSEIHIEDDILQAAIFALTAFFRYLS